MEEVINYVLIGCVVLVNVFNALIVNLKNIKNGKVLKNVESEVLCMKCRLPDYQVKNPVKGSNFSKEKKEYIWDEVSQKVVPTGRMIDLQAIIESSADCALDKMLKKFNLDPVTFQTLAPNATNSESVADFTSNVDDDLDVLSRYKTKISEVRSTYGIDESVPDSQVFAKLNELKNAYVKKVESLKKEAVSNGEKTQD